MWEMVYQQMLHVMAYNCIKRPCVSNDIPGEPNKNPPYDFCWYYSNAWEFLYEILRDC